MDVYVTTADEYGSTLLRIVSMENAGLIYHHHLNGFTKLSEELLSRDAKFNVNSIYRFLSGAIRCKEVPAVAIELICNNGLGRPTKTMKPIFLGNEIWGIAFWRIETLGLRYAFNIGWNEIPKYWDNSWVKAIFEQRLKNARINEDTAKFAAITA